MWDFQCKTGTGLGNLGQLGTRILIPVLVLAFIQTDLDEYVPYLHLPDNSDFLLCLFVCPVPSFSACLMYVTQIWLYSSYTAGYNLQFHFLLKLLRTRYHVTP